jgi:hypothetical protein
VTLAEAGETDNSCHFIPLYGVFPNFRGFCSLMPNIVNLLLCVKDGNVKKIRCFNIK